MRQIFYEDPLLIATVIGMLAVSNYAVALFAVRRRETQRFIAYEPLSPGSPKARYALPFITAVPAIAFAFVPGVPAALFAGGYILVQLFGIAWGVGTGLATYGLRNPEAAHGQVRLGAEYQYRQQSSYLAGFVIFAAIVAALTRSLEFLGAVLWLSATSVGYLRRARQAARDRLPVTG